MAPKPKGRPLTFTPALAAKVIAGLVEGKSLRVICAAAAMPPESTVRGWVVDDVEGFAAQYTRARDIGLDCRADAMEAKLASEPDTQRARLLFDHDRWYLSKLAPKRYGDKLAVGQADDLGALTVIINKPA